MYVSGSKRQATDNRWGHVEAHVRRGPDPLVEEFFIDFRSGTQLVPGTQGVCTNIGHVGFWAGVVYGNGIFMTVSPSEWHNHLAIRLIRDCAQDQFDTACPQVMVAAAAQAEADRGEQERKLRGPNAPSIETRSCDRLETHIPGYDMCRLMLARDPLAATTPSGCAFARCWLSLSACACALIGHIAQTARRHVQMGEGAMLRPWVVCQGGLMASSAWSSVRRTVVVCICISGTSYNVYITLHS